MSEDDKSSKGKPFASHLSKNVYAQEHCASIVAARKPNKHASNRMLARLSLCFFLAARARGDEISRGMSSQARGIRDALPLRSLFCTWRMLAGPSAESCAPSAPAAQEAEAMLGVKT